MLPCGQVMRMKEMVTYLRCLKRTLKRISSLFVGHKGFVQKPEGTGKVC